MEPVERRFASLSALGRFGRGCATAGPSEGEVSEVWGMVFGGWDTGIFRFRSSSSSSNSLINTSKLVTDEFCGEDLFILIAGTAALDRIAGEVCVCAGDDGVESLAEIVEAFDFNEPGPPNRC